MKPTATPSAAPAPLIDEIITPEIEIPIVTSDTRTAITTPEPATEPEDLGGADLHVDENGDIVLPEI